MNKYIKGGLIFAAGIISGAVGMKIYFDRNYIVTEESIEHDEVVEEAVELTEDVVNEEVAVETERVLDPVNNPDDYDTILNNLRYKSDREAEILREQEEREVAEEARIDAEMAEADVDRTLPYRISQSEFESIDSYDSDEYTYYRDGYLTDSCGFPVDDDDIGKTIGFDYEHFFRDEDVDQVWIRNERIQMDFSIIRDLDRFEDVAPPRIRKMAGL